VTDTDVELINWCRICC